MTRPGQGPTEVLTSPTSGSSSGVRRFEVLVLHPERLYCEALAVALAQEERIGGVRFAEVGPALQADSWVPDMVVIDLGLPQGTGIQQAQLVRKTIPKVRILITGCSELESEIVACIEAGASGCLLAGTSLKELIESILAVGRGEAV